MQKFEFDRYANLLVDWTDFAEKHLYTCPDGDGAICFGAGISTNWGMQTHMKALSTFAVVWQLDEKYLAGKLDRDLLLERTLAMLRYALRTHLVGDYVCTNGEKWGHSWIYALGIERMFHAIEILWEHLTESDRALLKALLVSESDFLLDEYEIVAGTVVNNKPESNIWNGALLYRTCELYPDLARRAEYIEKAAKFFANGISIESDEGSDEIVDGRRIGDLFVGANMFDSYACNHHRYLNVGYMNICLSNIAMLHFFMKSRGKRCEDIVYHHLYDQWRLIRATTFDDGRLIRIGGDTRVRYSYCQDYALTAWSLIEDVFGEDCSNLENGWLEMLEGEVKVNGDGSFLSNRCGYYEDLSPIYYTRLETDRANSISMALYWHGKYDLDKDGKCEKIPLWRDEYHGAAFSLGEKRFSSFAFRAAEQPTGLIFPLDSSNIVEWKYNLSGRVVGIGMTNKEDVESCETKIFDGGFVAYGTTTPYTDAHYLREGAQREDMAKKYIAFAALPDDKTVLSIQRAVAKNRVLLVESAGITLNIPNDLYNGRKRTISSADGDMLLAGGDLVNKKEIISLGNYASADGKIAVASVEPLTLVRREKRQIGLAEPGYTGTLYCEELSSSYNGERRYAARGEEIFSASFAVSLGNIDDAKELYNSLDASNDSELYRISAIGADGKRYMLVANFSETESEIDPENLHTGDMIDLAEGKIAEKCTLSSGEAKIYRLD